MPRKNTPRASSLNAEARFRVLHRNSTATFQAVAQAAGSAPPTHGGACSPAGRHSETQMAS